MRALVTGAAGFIGSHLSAALLDSGASVAGIDCFTDYYSRAIKEANLGNVKGRPGFSFVEAALQDVDLPALLTGVTHIFHLAGQAGVRKSWGGDFDVYIRDNIQATQRLLEAIARMPIQKYVYSSSSSVYGNHVPLPMREDTYLQPLSPYGVTKLAGEHLGNLYCANHGVPAVSLRYFTVYGPRQRPDMAFQRFLTAARDGTPITMYGDGEQTRDFTYIANVVDGVLRACESAQAAGEVINVATGRRISLNELLRVMNQIVGTRLEPIYLEARVGDVRDSQADISKARALLGYEPAIGLEEGLQHTLDWCRSAGPIS